MSHDNSEIKAYLKNEWNNDKSWMSKRPVCCPSVEDGIMVSAIAKLRKLAKTLDEAYGKITCCL